MNPGDLLKLQVSDETDAIANELALRFAPHKLWLVGGSVRDAILGRDNDDLDFATDAVPTESEAILREWGEQFWDPGASYGTVCASKDGVRVEVTTLRRDTYDIETRKPDVEFGTDIWQDLRRRDFKVNAMAIEIPPAGGNKLFYFLPGTDEDLQKGVLTTAAEDPIQSFTDDPLRLVRAARFLGQLGFWMEFPTFQAMMQTAPQLQKVSSERIVAELDKLLVAPDVYRGVSLLEATDVAVYCVPEGRSFHAMDDLPPVVELGWAAWLFAAGPELAANRLKELKHTRHMITVVPRLIALANQFFARGNEWDPAQVRKFIWDAGEHFDAAMELIDVLGDTDVFASIWTGLDASGDLANLRQPLDGSDIMDWLDIPAGPLVGTAINVLQNHRLEFGPMSTADAYRVLDKWWAGKE